MKIDIRDGDALRAIQPVEAALYLRANGWVAPHVQAGRSATWQKQINDEQYEALLPMDAAVRDYALRMGDLLVVLAAVERRSQWEIYRDILTSTSDVVRIRIRDPELNDGTLPIEEHAQIAQKARDLVLAAACAATEPRAVWHKRKPGQAMEHVRRVRIGQSEQGSYVVTVLSRVTPFLRGDNEQLFEGEQPYERRVTRMLAQSLEALEEASERAAVTQQMTAFDEAIPLGVNANLCDAVVGLWGGEEVQRGLEFSFSWSPSRPVEDGAIRRITFSPDRLPVIREAGRQMRDRAPLPEFDLSGPVVRLDRPEGAAIGRATVVGIVDERQVRVAVDLTGDAYHSAVSAHDEGRTLAMSGTLVREGRGYILRNPEGVTVEAE